MLELQPDRILQGPWGEVVSHRDEIPSNAVVELKVFLPALETEREIGDLGGRGIGELYGHLFGAVSFGPPDLADREDHRAIVAAAIDRKHGR